MVFRLCWIGYVGGYMEYRLGFRRLLCSCEDVGMFHGRFRSSSVSVVDRMGGRCYSRVH